MDLGQPALSVWDTSESHRRAVTSLLLDSAPERQASLCLLGAGECNDVDLGDLAKAYQQIILVDLNREALNRALVRQGSKPWRTATADLFGIRLLIDNPGRYERKHVTSVAKALRRVGTGSFSTVASLCMLSQGILQLEAIGELDQVRLSQIRSVHIQLLLTLRERAGVAWLFTDVVSSETVEDLADYSNVALHQLVPVLARTRNHFHGLHPWTLRGALQETCGRGDVSVSGPVGPWVWDMGVRQYMIVGFQLR